MDEEEETHKFWLTKWWATFGVRVEWCKIVNSAGGRLYACNRPLNIFLLIGRDAFESEEAANARLSELAERKIKALKRQIAKVEEIQAGLRTAENK